MKGYLDIVEKVLREGVLKKNRTGVDALTIPGVMFEHDMGEGFPLLTTKKVAFRLVASEMEFFIRGKTDKGWLQDNNNHIWDEWCSPDMAPYGNDEAARARMKAERDLGPVYGWQWRHFGARYAGYDKEPQGRGIDQLAILTDRLKKNSSDRRMLVSAWNPVDIEHMALPPCHYLFQVTVIDRRLNLIWNQRSVDVALGLPFNIAGYGLLLHLLAREAGLEEGKLIGFLGDTHIYTSHVEGLKEQLSRTPKRLPRLVTPGFTSLFEWHYQDSLVEAYESYPAITFDVAV